MSFLSDFK